MTKNNHEILYHYTNEDGLKGVLESQTLWATHYTIMRNDEKELRHFTEYLLRRLSEKPITFSKRKIKCLVKSIDTVLHNFHDGIENFSSPEIYVTCFCPDGNSKSLRNKYGGYSIGFDKQVMDELRHMEIKRFGFDMSMFNPVIYDDEKNIPEYSKREVDEIIDELNNYVKGKTNDKKKAVTNFLLNVTLFKCNKWSDEHEFRLVVGKLYPNAQLTMTKNKTVKYRKNKDGQVIPYIELFNDPYTILPIREIIVGASLNYEDNKVWIERLLREKRMENTRVISG